MENKIKIAIQTKGRLNEDSMGLINEAGIGLKMGRRTLVSEAKNFPMDALFLRDDDIPQTVADGVAAIGDETRLAGIVDTAALLASADRILCLGHRTRSSQCGIGGPTPSPARVSTKRRARSDIGAGDLVCHRRGVPIARTRRRARR